MWKVALQFSKRDQFLSRLHHVFRRKYNSIENNEMPNKRIASKILPREASMSWRSSLSMKPSRFWSIMLNASLNSWICDWSNIAKTLEVARWGRFLVIFPLVRHLLDILAVFGFTYKLEKNKRHYKQAPTLTEALARNKEFIQLHN